MNVSAVPGGPVRPPVEVVLARAARDVPGPAALPGGTVYEPKWDGFRLVMFAPGVDGEPVMMQSRRGKDLSGYFPELVDAAATLPTGAAVDGEVVVWEADRLDFAALQRRLTPSRARARLLAAEQPASFVAFDLLAAGGGADVRRLPWAQRRDLLADLATGWRPPLHLTPSTMDPAEAGEWFTDFAVAGLEGLVAKGASTRYRGGRRDWVKVRSRDSIEVVVGAVLGDLRAPAGLVVGLPGRAATLRIVGRTSAPSSAQVRALAAHLVETSAHPWPPTVAASVVGALPGSREPVPLRRVEPLLVVEVGADVSYERGRFRHPLPLLRLRPDVDAAEVRRPPHL